MIRHQGASYDFYKVETQNFASQQRENIHRQGVVMINEKREQNYCSLFVIQSAKHNNIFELIL